jgi:hypothetical protein
MVDNFEQFLKSREFKPAGKVKESPRSLSLIFYLRKVECHDFLPCPTTWVIHARAIYIFATFLLLHLLPPHHSHLHSPKGYCSGPIFALRILQGARSTWLRGFREFLGMEPAPLRVAYSSSEDTRCGPNMAPMLRLPGEPGTFGRNLFLVGNKAYSSGRDKLVRCVGSAHGGIFLSH